eukprot:COSAG01_NODE_1173_length_11400_cov_2.767366_19_plen_132_part_00
MPRLRSPPPGLPPRRLLVTTVANLGVAGGSSPTRSMSDNDRSAAQRLMTLDRSPSIGQAGPNSNEVLRQMKEYSKRQQTSVTMRTLLDTADGILLDTTPPQAQPSSKHAGKLSQCERTLLQVQPPHRLRPR